MSDLAASEDPRFTRLLERLLTAAEASLAAGDLEPARATAEEVRAVDPDNERARRILRQLAARQRAPSGERALMTLLFSDLVGSTLLSERVEPEQLRDLFSFYRAAAREAVERYSGQLIQFSGDGVLAGFGYPEPHEDDARRAVLAGLDLAVAMRDGRAEMERRVGAAAEVRVGIHTGRVVVTDFSNDASVAERDSIVGITPNLAARIQANAEPGTVVISDVTQQLVDTDFYLQSRGEHQFKGISRPVEVFAVEGPRFAAARFAAERYRKSGLVGRDEPRTAMLEAWQSIRTDEGGVRPGASFLVVGEAGIGKSRLVAEVLDRVEASAGRVLGAGCLPYYANVSLWPIAQMLERALGLSGGPERKLRALVAHLADLDLDLGRSVPFLAALVGVAPSDAYPRPELDPIAFLDETLNHVVEWLTAVAASTPHLLVVEDLHWADPSTLALLGRLVGRAPSGLLTVATTRDSHLVPWTQAVEVVELDHLDRDEAMSLVTNLVAGQDLSDDRCASIVAQADGIPLYIEELTRSCLAEDRGEPMPLRLQELFTWRFRAPGVDLRVVQVAATVGPTFPAGLVSAVIRDEALVIQQLEVLVDHGIIERGDPESGRYRFRHALMRDAAYETQVLDVRRETHANVAEAMAAQGAEPALIAAHLDLAGMAERAAALYVAAAQGEQARGAHTEAARLVTRALELYEGLPESEERDLAELGARMLRVLSISSMRGYAAPEVQADHSRAEALTTALGSRPEVLPAVIGIYGYRLTNGDVPTARMLIERLMGMIRQPAFAWFDPEVEECAGYVELYQGNLGAARTYLERSMAGYEGRPDDAVISPYWPLPNDPKAASAIGLACIAALQGDVEAASRWEHQAVERAEGLGFPRGPFTLGFVKTYAAWIRQFLGDDVGARRLGAEVVQVGQQHGYAYWMMLGSAYVATALPGGEPDREFLEQTVASLRLMGHEAFLGSMLAHLARLHAQAGDVDRASELIDEAVEAVHKSGEYLHLPELLRQRAGFALSRGAHADDVVADLQGAVDVAVEQEATVSYLRAALELARLPEDRRPIDWRITLDQARQSLPPSFRSAESAAADALLSD
ncbi:adenylate/guanylate cyclase domain-containing protein [Intrasporangium sp.]|uniref:ATP-binding protein n=1 Tax=Intrasporangium sp. TaxID=1925024 RepID=UPI003365998C